MPQPGLRALKSVFFVGESQLPGTHAAVILEGKIVIAGAQAEIINFVIRLAAREVIRILRPGHQDGVLNIKVHCPAVH